MQRWQPHQSHASPSQIRERFRVHQITYSRRVDRTQRDTYHVALLDKISVQRSIFLYIQSNFTQNLVAAVDLSLEPFPTLDHTAAVFAWLG